MPKRKPSRALKSKYCGLSCHYAAVRAAHVRRDQACVVCSNLFHAKSKTQPTCSQKCGGELRKSKLRRQRKCNHCGVNYWPGMTTRTKYCSRKCLNAEVGKRPAFIESSCAECGTKFKRTAAALKRTRNSFCSPACVARFNRGANHVHFRGDKDPNRGAAWNRLAQSIRVRDGYTCRRCGRCESGNGQKLSVDHIRPWRTFKDKAAANHPDNLAALCRGCHSHKTIVVESAWLRGDVLAWKQWVASLHLQSAVKFGWSA